VHHQTPSDTQTHAASTTDNLAAGLKREVGLWGAVMMGLGSILGTGVFVSIAIATDVAGPAVVLAIAAAAMVAIFNGLSSAQLAAAYPVSGGTYEYAYRLIHPGFGFTAGWMFLCAKSASAATAALGLAGAMNQLLNIDGAGARIGVAAMVVLLLTILILMGIRRSNHTNLLIVGITLASLVVFVLAAGWAAWPHSRDNFSSFFAPVREGLSPLAGFLQGVALMFVAFTGYGRIATLAEEVHHPRRTIPAAVIVTLMISMGLYMAIGWVGIAAVGAREFAMGGGSQVAPLQTVAHRLGQPTVVAIVAIGGITAMLGVTLNLILGLSRVALAMGRRRDIPSYFALIDEKRGSPDRATWLVALLILLLVAVGNVRLTWSFSAFTVLIYYAITNLAAIRLPAQQRLYPALIPWLGLISCLGLAFWVDRQVWLLGSALIAMGLIWHAVARSVLKREGN